MNSMNKGNDFPFDAVILTSPDAAAAEAAALGPLASLHLPNHVQILSTSDPLDVRCGSGGGTLAALDLLQEEKSTCCTVLIVHAGGQSSRCPTQMVLGKAWTSLPLIHSMSNPTFMLIHSLARLFQNVPKGSVVVAASDVLLSLPNATTSIDLQVYQDQDAVLGLAVPAPLTTATNHGVFGLPPVNSQEVKVVPVDSFLQKPSLEELQKEPGLHFFQNSTTTTTSSAWIDTGVVLFLPRAAAALHQLKEGLLQCCTKRGLMELYQKETCPTTLKVELYSHLLMALSTTTTTSASEESYLSQHQQEMPRDVLKGIYKTLSPYKLQALVVPHGQFRHLGTTRELVCFLTQQQDDFGRQELGLVRRSGSHIIVGGTSVHSSSVVLNSLLLEECHDTTNESSVGKGTVIEHTFLTLGANGSIHIGANCLVSSVRGEVEGKLEMPSDTCLAVLPLQSEEYVYMYFGIQDDVKGCSTWYGLPIQDVLKWTGLSASDIWDANNNDKTLWNAKIHPVVVRTCHHKVEFPSLLAWVAAMRNDKGCCWNNNPGAKSSFKKWKLAKRLSFAEIREAGDAKAEFQYRNHLSAKIKEKKEDHCRAIQQLLLRCQHKPCDLDCLIKDHVANNGHFSPDVRQLLGALDDVVRQGMQHGKLDVCSRALMIMSGLLSDLANSTEHDSSKNDGDSKSLNDNAIATDMETLRSSCATKDEMLQSCEAVFSYRNELLNENGAAPLPPAVLNHCACCLENVALAFIEHCVFDRDALEGYRQRTIPAAPLDTWVTASAPVRIDLSGGWSDTPPISYEYGGAVACLAVTVDGHKPLSAKCRFVSGGKGLVLCTESRDISGKLLSQTRVEIDSGGGLADYRNPCSDCALIKCALILFGLVPSDKVLCCEEQDLQPYINAFCGSDVDVGLEIVSTSLLPHGSGMGTSSILGGCVLAAVGRCIGVDMVATDTEESNSKLIHAVLTLEQLLSTGGGWQDQVGGLVGGLKLPTSKAHAIPLRTNVQCIPMTPNVIAELDHRLVLAYSGKTRIAKNILQNVLRRWARRSPDICQTVQELVLGARAAVDALQAGDLNELGRCLNVYWQQKKIMAGEDSGAEPDVVKAILDELLKRNEIVGGSLCGAGGGGFMVLLAAAGRTGVQIQQTIENELSEIVKDVDKFTWHECRVSQDGLTVQVERAATSHNGL